MSAGAAGGVKMFYVAVGTVEAKLPTLVELLQALRVDPRLACAVACSSRDSVDAVVHALASCQGFSVAVLHADLEPHEAEQQVLQIKRRLAPPAQEQQEQQQEQAQAQAQAQAQQQQQQAQQAEQRPPGAAADAAAAPPPRPHGAADPAGAPPGPPGAAPGDGRSLVLVASDACLRGLARELLPVGLPLLVNFDLPGSKDALSRRLAAVFGSSKERGRRGAGGGAGACVAVDFVAAGEAAAFRARERLGGVAVQEMPVHVPDIFARPRGRQQQQQQQTPARRRARPGAMDRLFDRAFNKAHGVVHAVTEEASRDLARERQASREQQLRALSTPMTAEDVVERIGLAFKDGDYFRLLQLPAPTLNGLGRAEWGVSGGEVSKAYRKLSILVHPDKAPGPAAREAFEQLKAAYSELRDPDKLAARLRDAEPGLQRAAERVAATVSMTERVEQAAAAEERKAQLRQEQARSFQEEIRQQMKRRQAEAEAKKQRATQPSKYAGRRERGDGGDDGGAPAARAGGSGSDSDGDYARRQVSKKRRKPAFIAWQAAAAVRRPARAGGMEAQQQPDAGSSNAPDAAPGKQGAAAKQGGTGFFMPLSSRAPAPSERGPGRAGGSGRSKPHRRRNASAGALPGGSGGASVAGDVDRRRSLSSRALAACHFAPGGGRSSFSVEDRLGSSECGDDLSPPHGASSHSSLSFPSSPLHPGGGAGDGGGLCFPASAHSEHAAAVAAALALPGAAPPGGDPPGLLAGGDPPGLFAAAPVERPPALRLSGCSLDSATLGLMASRGGAAISGDALETFFGPGARHAAAEPGGGAHALQQQLPPLARGGRGGGGGATSSPSVFGGGVDGKATIFSQPSFDTWTRPRAAELPAPAQRLAPPPPPGMPDALGETEESIQKRIDELLMMKQLLRLKQQHKAQQTQLQQAQAEQEQQLLACLQGAAQCGDAGGGGAPAGAGAALRQEAGSESAAEQLQQLLWSQGVPSSDGFATSSAMAQQLPHELQVQTSAGSAPGGSMQQLQRELLWCKVQASGGSATGSGMQHLQRELLWQQQQQQPAAALQLADGPASGQGLAQQLERLLLQQELAASRHQQQAAAQGGQGGMFGGGAACLSSAMSAPAPGALAGSGCLDDVLASLRTSGGGSSSSGGFSPTTHPLQLAGVGSDILPSGSAFGGAAGRADGLAGWGGLALANGSHAMVFAGGGLGLQS
ncbi:hypothetical protein HT031_005440 [Scenedesmus sp. PABB004]|nr:hypothetical protein HT031_005440 [Scenedesmus sp. PABB004]